MIKEHKANYKIYHFGKNHYDKIVDERFYAKNDDDAYKYLQAFINTTSNENSIAYYYYYATIHYAIFVDNDGNKGQEYDIDDTCYANKLIYAEKSFIKRIYKTIKDFFEYWLIIKVNDIRYAIRDFIYLMKNKEAYSNQWNLDLHLLDSIERNVPSLIENSNALAFIDEAIVKVHGNDPGFDIKKYHEEHYAGYPEDIEKLAIEIQNTEYSNLLLYVKLYKYYSTFGFVDFTNSEEIEFDKKWRHTLPIKPGTYDEIADYDKLTSLSNEYWNKIWDWMKVYGQKLND